MLTQRHEEKRVGEHASAQERERERALWPLFLYVIFPPLGLPYVNWASQECCLFYLRSLFRSSELPLTFLCSIFEGSVVFWPPPFWTPVSYSNYLTLPPQEMGGPILWE